MEFSRGYHGKSYKYYRPAKPIGRGFPVYPRLVDDLLAAGTGYDAQVAHVCSVLSGWAYSDPETVAMMMVRLGLENNRTRFIQMLNDTMFICSNSFLIQSGCGRVAWLCYRGTEPL